MRVGASCVEVKAIAITSGGPFPTARYGIPPLNNPVDTSVITHRPSLSDVYRLSELVHSAGRHTGALQPENDGL